MLHAQSSGNSLSGFASAGAPTAELARGLSELPRPSSPLVSPLAHSLSTALGDRQQQQQQQQQLLRRHDPFGSPHHVPTDALDEQMLRHAGGGTVGEPPATTTAWGSRAGHSFSIRSNGGAGSPGHSITEEASTRSLGQPSWVSKVQQKPSVVSPKPRHLMPPDSERTSTGSELPLSPLPVDPWRQRPGSPGTPSSAAASPVHSPPLQVASPPTHLSSGNCIASVSTSAQHRSHPSSPSAAASSTRAVSQSDSQTAATATAATATAATAAAIRNGTQSSGSSPPRVIDTSVCAVPSGGGTGVLRGLSRCPTVSPSMVLFESPNDTRVDPAWRQNARRSLDLSTPQQQQQQQQLQRNGSSAWHRSRSRLGGKPAATSPLLPQFFMSNATFDPDATRSAGTAAEGSPRRRRPDPDASYGPEYDEETEELERILMGGVSAPPAAHAASGTGGSAAVRRPETADRAAVLSRRPPSVAATTADGDDSSLFGLQKLSTQQSADLHRTMVDLHHSRHAGTTGGVASPRIASVSRSASRLPLGTAGQSAAASSRRMSLGGLSVGSTSTTGHVLARQMQAPRRSSELMNGDDGGHLPRSRTDEPTSLFGDLSNHRPDGSGQQRCSTPGSSTTTTRFLMPQDRRAISPQPSDVWQAASKDRLILTPNGDDSHHKPQQRRSAQSDPFDSSRQEDALQRGDDDDEPGPAPTPSHHHHHNAIPLEGKSFWYFGRRHRLRRRAYNLVHRRWFDNVMFTLILANCVTMAMEHPRIVDGSPMDRFIFWSNVGFTFCFTVEAALKIFACTFILYIRRLANQVDFAIVVVSLVEILLEVVASGVGWAQALRVLRVFKPLRTLTRSRNMQLVFRSLTMSLAAMAHVTLVLLIFFLMFAILGTQLFMGRFYRCNDASVHDKAECVDVFIDYEGMAQNRTWNNQFPNFDNVGNALLVCFITATLNGYTNTMEATMSAPLRCDVQPQLSMNALAFFWYLGFGVVVSFTLLNLYVGVIFSQFSKMRLQSQTGSAFLTPEQQEWAELSKMVFRLEVPHKFVAPTHWLRLRLYHLVRHPGLDTVMMAVVCLNVVTMAMIWWQQSEEFLDALDYANVAFTAVYVAEAVLKIAGLGWRQYWRNAWNKFDFVLAVVGVSDVILTYCVAGTNAFLNVQKLLRLARLARMIKLMRSASGIKHMVKTLIAALPAFGNIFALLALFYFMYAYVGVWLLGLVDHGANLNRWANFDNFLFASMTLFRIATGDNWSDVLMGSIPYNGVPGSTIDNGGTYAAIPYILSFYIVIPIIMVNLFTAVIIETFDKENEQDAWKLSPQALDEFVALWAEYDDGSGTIATASLEALLLRLDPPLGLGPCATNKDVLHFVYDLDIPLVHGRVPFHKTAFELVKRCSMANIPEGMLKQQMDALVVHFFRDLQEDKNNTFTMTVVVQKLQRKWRTRLRAARLQRKMRWRDDRATAPSYVHTWSRRAALLERAQSDSRLISSGVKSRWSFPAVHSPPITAASEARGRFPAAYTSPATSAGESHRLAGHPAAPDEGKGHWQYIQRLFLGKKLIPKNG